MKRLVFFILFFPLQVTLLTIFLVTDLLGWLLRLTKSEPEPGSTDEPGELCSIVILNWNGRRLLEEGIPAVLRAVRKDGRRHQILVVDNGSEDDSVSWLRGNFPDVEILEIEENIGFVEGNNLGVQEARNGIVVLLNNDMLVDEDFLAPLIDGFSDPSVFAVTSQIQFPEGKRREETGNTQGNFRAGYLHLAHAPVREYHYTRRYLPVLWAGGGSTAFLRDRFVRLGGFSEVFSPCYFEDTDLSYRAWRRGWKVLLAAESQVLHKHRSSTSVRFGATELQQIMDQRRFWYLWKNLECSSLFSNFLLTPFHFGKWVSLTAYLLALRKIPRVLWLRLTEPPRVFGDRQIFDWARRPVSYLNEFYPDRHLSSRNGEQPLRILFLSAYLPHLGTHGGAGRVFQLMKRVARKHQVSLMAFTEDEKDEAFAAQPRAFCEIVNTVLRRDYVPVSHFPYEPFEEFNSPVFRRRLEELLAARDFDLVHFEWTQMAMYADLFPSIPKLMTEIEVNYAAHQTLIGVEPNKLRKIRLFYNTLQTLYREIEMCKESDRVICVTEDDRDYLRGYVSDRKLDVVNTGVDPSYFHYNVGGMEKNALVFVGAFRHSPNLDAMRFFYGQIFPLIKRECPDVRLYIVGSSPPKSIRDLEKDPQVTVTGFVEDIRDYYRKAQVVVVPLRTGVGIRGKILESWSAGRATVATRLACQGIRVFHGDNIIIADQPDEFARWTIALLRRPGYCKKLGLRGRETVEQFYDWDRLGEQMTEIYEDLSNWPDEKQTACEPPQRGTAREVP